MAYVTLNEFRDQYLFGRESVMPDSEFTYWENKASRIVDALTSDRLRDADTMASNREAVVQCVCELAEYLFWTEDSLGKKSQGGNGYSITYEKGGDRGIVLKHLGRTGLMFRGVG